MLPDFHGAFAKIVKMNNHPNAGPLKLNPSLGWHPLAVMVLYFLHLGDKVKDVTIRDRVLARSDYGTILLVPGKYTLHERDDASIGITIRPVLINSEQARAKGELILGHTYVLHAGKSAASGERALWIEDARSGEVFIDTR